jgi:hypothetical protein
MKAHVRDYNPNERLPQWWAWLPSIPADEVEDSDVLASDEMGAVLIRTHKGQKAWLYSIDLEVSA